MFYIYILHSENLDKYYVGYSANPWERLKQHNENEPHKFTGKAKDWRLKAVFEVSADRGEAMRVEQFIKAQKSRKLIELLISGEREIDGVLGKMVRVPIDNPSGHEQGS